MLLITESVVERKGKEDLAKAENFQREAILGNDSIRRYQNARD